MGTAIFPYNDYKSCQLEGGRVYFVKMVKVTDERKRNFMKPGTSKRVFVFDVYFEDENGAKLKAEYISETPEQNVMVEGVMQYIKCSQSGQVADEIEPYEPTEQMLNNNNNKNVLQAVNKNLSIAGTTYSCAMICASNIMAGELNSCPGALVDEGFKVKLFDLAEDINGWLLAKRDM